MCSDVSTDMGIGMRIEMQNNAVHVRVDMRVNTCKPGYEKR